MNLFILLATHTVSMDMKAGALYALFAVLSFIVAAYNHGKKKFLFYQIPVFLLATLLSVFAYQYTIVSYIGMFFGIFFMLGIAYFERQKPRKP
jgi:hypothetical protein